MAEATATNVPPKAAPKPMKPVTASTGFEAPKFDVPNFDVPKMEIPQAFRELAEKTVSQARETYEKLKSAAEEATDVIENTYANASKGASDYGLKVIETARENTNATFNFYAHLMTVKSLSEIVELSSAHLRRQFEALTSQSKELAALAQKVATDTAEPMKESVSRTFKRAS